MNDDRGSTFLKHYLNLWSVFDDLNLTKIHHESQRQTHFGNSKTEGFSFLVLKVRT